MEPTITLHPSELLRQVGSAMNRRHTEILVTVPMVTTWKAVLRAIDSALGEVDGPVMVLTPRPESHRQMMRHLALEEVRREKEQSLSSSATATGLGLPIRTRYDIQSLPLPTASSKTTRKRLMEDAKPFDRLPDPYPVTLRASIVERTLPAVKVNIMLYGLDSKTTDPRETLKSVDMLWDTGAYQTIVNMDMLSEPFRRYLQDSQHDPYRYSDGGLRVHMDAQIGFSNVPMRISAVVLVVPKNVIPNARIGVLFGQKQCIDRINYRSIPRRVLKAKGEEIGEEIWGDLVLDELIDVDDELRSFNT